MLQLLKERTLVRASKSYYFIGQTNVEAEEEADIDLEVEAMVEDIGNIRKIKIFLTFPFRRSRSPPRRHRRSRSRSYRKDSRSRDMKEGRCFECGKRGHIKRECPEIRGGRRSRSRSYSPKMKRGGGRRRSYSSSRSRGRDRSRSKGRRRSPSSRSRGSRSGGRRSYSNERHNPEVDYRD